MWGEIARQVTTSITPRCGTSATGKIDRFISPKGRRRKCENYRIKGLFLIFVGFHCFQFSFTVCVSIMVPEISYTWYGVRLTSSVVSYKDKVSKEGYYNDGICRSYLISKISVDKWIKLLKKSHIASRQHRMGEGGRKISGSLRLTGAKRRMKTKERNQMRGGKQSVSGEKQVESGGKEEQRDVRKSRRALTLSGPFYSPCTGHTWAWGWAC